MEKRTMKATLELELFQTQTGHTYSFEISPRTVRGDMIYGAARIEIVVLSLDGRLLVSRLVTDYYSDDWEIGTIDDIVEKALRYQGQALEAGKLVQYWENL